jgi:hypothetical protein
MHYPSPQWLAKLMDYIHTWLNKWRMQGISPKAGDGFTLRGELQYARERTKTQTTFFVIRAMNP